MMTIAENHVVEMNYKLTSTDGEMLDSSEGKGPLAFIMGHQNIIPGLEKGMAGKSVGDKFKVSVAPEEAYGMRDDRMVQSVPKEHFGADAEKIEIGSQIQVQDQSGQVMIVTAVEIKEQEIVLDGNHPLAGETLHFDVEIVNVRDASEEEVAQGQVKAKSSECDPNGGCC